MEYPYTVTVIDVGVIHLGLCVAEVSEDFTDKRIVWVDLIDITQYTHRMVPRDECTLYHTRNFADWVNHFVQEHGYFLEVADLILIEKQPPQGFVVIEQLLFHLYRHKTHLMSPRQIHCYLNFSHLDYEMRKEYAVKIADRELPDHLREQTHFYDRRHDIADCVCMLLYYMRRKADEYKRKKRREMLSRDFQGMSVAEKLETFRFIPLFFSEGNEK